MTALLKLLFFLLEMVNKRSMRNLAAATKCAGCVRCRSIRGVQPCITHWHRRLRIHRQREDAMGRGADVVEHRARRPGRRPRCRAHDEARCGLFELVRHKRPKRVLSYINYDMKVRATSVKLSNAIHTVCCVCGAGKSRS